MIPDTWGVALAAFFAAFTGAVTGFGSALVGMPLLAQILPVQVAAPLMAVISLCINSSMLVIQRQAFRWQAVWQLILAAIIGIPVGILLVSTLSEQVVLTILGVLLIAYAVYAWVTPRLPELKHPIWKYVFGFFSGVLGGAYNVGGPPAVVYASSKGWEASEFRSNLQALFLVENIVILAGHAWAGNYTTRVLGYLPYAIPALAAGIVLGVFLDRFIPDKLFRKMVLILLVVLGLALIF